MVMPYNYLLMKLLVIAAGIEDIISHPIRNIRLHASVEGSAVM